MNYLELADDLIREVTGAASFDESITSSAMGCAAALIAIAERMDEQNRHLERISKQLGLGLRMAESINTFGDLSMVYDAEQE